LVKQLTMLVTPEGKWVLPESEEFHAALGDPSPDYDAVGFAIRNLGFVKYQVFDRVVTEIELHPRNVNLPTMLALEKLLGETTTNLFRIKYLEDEWHSEISASAQHIVTRLRELCAPVFEPPPTARFRVEPQDCAKLLRDGNNPLRLLVQKWRMAFGVFDPNVISLALSHQLLPRLVIAGVKSATADPVWRFIGEGHKWIGSDYKLSGIGEKVANMPDKDYGNWVSEFYRSVAISGQPRYDFVTGSVRYEDENGKPVKPVYYERLMLPWKTPSEEVFVTGCTRKFGTDDIPSLEAEEDGASKTFAMSS
jgi:hypothetical protein